MLNERYEIYLKQINDFISKMLPKANLKQALVIDAMNYSLEAGGKRIRPVLVLEFCRMCGGNTEKALPIACAIEAAHTFSLIHDDLPAMDNDDLRRGKPSCHKAFDEATAILAGDALAIFPFELISASDLSDEQKVAVIAELSKSLGVYGMIGGQQIDTQFEGEKYTTDELLSMYELKTSRLLSAACCCGAISAGADKVAIENARVYATKMGLAFQIIDDILDVTGDESSLGKPIGSDSENCKCTYVTLTGLENAEKKANELTNSSLEILDGFDDNEFLKQLTQKLLNRKK